MFPHTNQCYQEHWQGGHQMFYARQVFIAKHLKLILSTQHHHQIRLWCSFPYRNFKGSWMEKYKNVWQIL